MKSGQRVNTAIDKTRKQVLVYTQYQQMRAQARAMKLSSAGKLWEYEDFEGMKMYAFCKEIQMSLEEKVKENEPVRTLIRLWKEWCEQKKIRPQGNHLLEARLMNKYGGLKFFDIDQNNRVITVHKMVFVKQRVNNSYHVFAAFPGYDPNIGDHDKPHYPYWQPWEINEDLFDCMGTYYETEGKGDNVKVFDKGDDCQSNEE